MTCLLKESPTLEKPEACVNSGTQAEILNGLCKLILCEFGLGSTIR